MYGIAHTEMCLLLIRTLAAHPNSALLATNATNQFHTSVRWRTYISVQSCHPIINKFAKYNY